MKKNTYISKPHASFSYAVKVDTNNNPSGYVYTCKFETFTLKLSNLHPESSRQNSGIFTETFTLQLLPQLASKFASKFETFTLKVQVFPLKSSGGVDAGQERYGCRACLAKTTPPTLFQKGDIPPLRGVYSNFHPIKLQTFTLKVSPCKYPLKWGVKVCNLLASSLASLLASLKLSPCKLQTCTMKVQKFKNIVPEKP